MKGDPCKGTRKRTFVTYVCGKKDDGADKKDDGAAKKDDTTSNVAVEDPC